MEVEVLRGARTTLQNLKPILCVEILKSDKAVIKRLFDELGYRYFAVGISLMAVHMTDPVLQRVDYRDGAIYVS